MVNAGVRAKKMYHERMSQGLLDRGREGGGEGEGEVRITGKVYCVLEPVPRKMINNARWECLFVCLLNEPATCECISGTDLLSTETEVADPTLHLTQSQYTDTGPTSPSAGPITPGAWQDSHWSVNFEVTGMTQPRKIPSQKGFESGIFRCRVGRLNQKANEVV